MIARILRGITSLDLADAYREHLQEQAIPRLRGVDGLAHAYILQRAQGDKCEFQVVTFWRDMKAMREWVGGDPEQAVYLDQEERYLLDMEPLVHLYDAHEILD